VKPLRVLVFSLHNRTISLRPIYIQYNFFLVVLTNSEVPAIMSLVNYYNSLGNDAVCRKWVDT